MPWLDYDVATDVTAASTVTMTFEDPDGLGRDVEVTDLPASGQLLWPGAELDADGEPIDWPGWRLDGAVWVADDTDAWVRGPLTVRIEMDGAEADAIVTYPAASDACEAAPEAGVQSGTGNSSPSADTGNAAAGAATPPSTSTLPSAEPQHPGAPMAILAILAVIFGASVAAADRGKRTRRRR